MPKFHLFQGIEEVYYKVAFNGVNMWRGAQRSPKGKARIAVSGSDCINNM